jgi:hypothetical protein
MLKGERFKVESLNELQLAVEQIGLKFTAYKTDSINRIAVAGLIFCNDGRVLLVKRGKQSQDEQGSLEGVGGGIDKQLSLHDALRIEIGQELRDENGGPLRVSIDQFLDFQTFKFRDKHAGGLRDWIVVTYLCRLHEGSPSSNEPDKIEELKFLTLDALYTWPAQGDPENIPEAQRREPLSPWTVHVREVYKKKYGNQPFFQQR